jgi:hypothetical protein
MTSSQGQSALAITASSSAMLAERPCIFQLPTISCIDRALVRAPFMGRGYDL